MDMFVPSEPGIYIVALKNEHPISVNADRPKIADRCIFVTKANCKFGKATDLARRKREYQKTFGEQYVVFWPIAKIENPSPVESAIGSRLLSHRIRGLSGKPNEWLSGITSDELAQLVIEILESSTFDYELLTNAQPLASKQILIPAPTPKSAALPRKNLDTNSVPIGVSPSMIVRAAKYLQLAGMSLNQLRRLHHSKARAETFKATIDYFSGITDLKEKNRLYGARLMHVEGGHKEYGISFDELVRSALELFPMQ
jgi:hypothetical protein